MEKYVLSKQEKQIFESLKQAFAVYQFVDGRVVTLALSDGFCRLFGYEDRAQAYYDMDNDMYKDTHPDDAARIANAAFHFAVEDGSYDVIYRTRKKDSSDYIILHAMGEHVYTEDGVRLAQVWYMDEGTYVRDPGSQVDVTGTMSSVVFEQSMSGISRYDFLTGLPSMTHFFNLAEFTKDAILRNGGEPMLLYMDFSGMKFYNTKYGFAQGDKALQSFARLLANIFGNENCCRIGADHFAVISEELGLEEKLDRLLREFAELNGGNTPPVHVGIYPHRVEDVPSSTACDRAKFACKLIKDSYSSSYNYYSAQLREDAVLRQYIIENIDTAIREKWIQVYLQPIVRTVNERVCDVEALARWIDPEKGILSPVSFIPALESAGLIYKLDLYMVEQVVEAIKMQQNDNMFVVPHSINLSRSDFDSCDIVEEIRRRVDAAGISRDLITIEITESVIGMDYEFMKEQVERFQSLGFPVWMDDFGSGYSSLDVLQSVKFDLLKFDMSFMRKLDEGESGKVILTELMRMATSLGIDTVCEGVETKEQIRFLQEIGCAKLQGFYYSKPLPYNMIREMHETGVLIQHENPEESEYYESIGRVNLFDLGVIAEDEETAFTNVFNTLPIAVLEIREDSASYLRCNRSYQEFVRKFFNFDALQDQIIFNDSEIEYGSPFISAVRRCRESGSNVFFDEKMPDGTRVHSVIRRINNNPVTGSMAIAIAILSVKEPDESTTYAEIAKALATDYYNIYVIDMETDEYIEYSSKMGADEISIERHGKDFFESARREAGKQIYVEDQEQFLKLFTKERILQDLDKKGMYTIIYRHIRNEKPAYVNMKITKMYGSSRVILGISNVDEQVKQKLLTSKLQKERETLVRVMALSDGYLSVFTVDPETGQYYEYSSSEDFDSLGAAKDGEDFFRQAYIDAFTYIYEPDRKRFQEQFIKENVLREIREHGGFKIDYRLMINKEPRPVTLKAALFHEGADEKLVVGIRAWRERKEN